MEDQDDSRPSKDRPTVIGFAPQNGIRNPRDQTLKDGNTSSSCYYWNGPTSDWLPRVYFATEKGAWLTH